VTHFLKSINCLFGVHSPIRDYQIEDGQYVKPLVLVYRCGSCLQDLGPILKKDKIMRAPTTEPYTVADQRARLRAGSET
jgi:hypothetical protein